MKGTNPSLNWIFYFVRSIVFIQFSLIPTLMKWNEAFTRWLRAQIRQMFAFRKMQTDASIRTKANGRKKVHRLMKHDLMFCAPLSASFTRTFHFVREHFFVEYTRTVFFFARAFLFRFGAIFYYRLKYLATFQLRAHANAKYLSHKCCGWLAGHAAPHQQCHLNL